MKQKVLLVSNSAWNINNFRLNLLQQLNQFDYSVAVACPDIQTLNDDIVSFGDAFYETGKFSYRRRDILNSLLVFWKLAKVLYAFKPNIVISYTIKPNILIGLLSYFFGFRFYPVITGLGTSFTQQDYLPKSVKSLYKLAFKRANQVVFQNKDDKSLFQLHRIVRLNQCTLIPGSGVDSQHFCTKKAVFPDPPVFLFVGRLIRSKGIMEFARASAAFLKEKKAIFQVLGAEINDHPDSLTPAELAELKGYEGLQLLGEHADVRPFIESCTAVVLPSYREGLPKSILEAMSMAKPVIVSQVPGCTMVFEQQEKPGLMFRPKSTTALLEALLQVSHTNTSTLEQFGLNGRKLILDHFSQVVINRTFLQMLSSNHE